MATNILYLEVVGYALPILRTYPCLRIGVDVGVGLGTIGRFCEVDEFCCGCGRHYGDDRLGVKMVVNLEVVQLEIIMGWFI